METKYGIMNYSEYEGGISAGAQPTEEQIYALKNDGIEAIVNISPASARNYLKSEAEITEKTGIIYAHIPIDCSALKPFHYSMFRNTLKALEGKKIFAHCGGNIKTSNLMHMYDVLERNVDENASLQKLKSIQNTESKWFDYFKSAGMKGLK